MDDWFAGEVGGGGACGVGRFKNWGGSMGGRDDFEMRGGKVDTSLRTHFVLD